MGSLWGRQEEKAGLGEERRRKRERGDWSHGWWEDICPPCVLPALSFPCHTNCQLTLQKGGTKEESKVFDVRGFLWKQEK